MMKVEYQINGRKVNASQLRNELERAVLRGLEEEIREKVGRSICPVHGEPPHIIFTGRTLDKLSFEVHGCCDQLTDAVRSQLA